MDAPVKRTRRRIRSGYTLIEVLVASAILLIALPGLVVMLTGTRKTQVASMRMDQAMSYGQLIVDSLGLLPATARGAGSQSASSNIGSTVYTARWTIPTSVGGTYAFPVQVSWSQAGRNHLVTVQAVLR